MSKSNFSVTKFFLSQNLYSSQVAKSKFGFINKYHLRFFLLFGNWSGILKIGSIPFALKAYISYMYQVHLPSKIPSIPENRSPSHNFEVVKYFFKNVTLQISNFIHIYGLMLILSLFSLQLTIQQRKENRLKIWGSFLLKKGLCALTAKNDPL